MADVPLRISELPTTASSPSLTTTYFVLDSLLFATAEKMTPDALFQQAFGPLYALPIQLSDSITPGGDLQTFIGDGSTLPISVGFNVDNSISLLKLGRVGATYIGAYGADPVDKPVVTGSAGGNAALQSLLTALDLIGWIDDQSS